MLKVVLYNPPIIDQGKAETVTSYDLWAEKDVVERAAILADILNSLFDVYSSYAKNAKLLWKNLIRHIILIHKV